MKPIKTPPLSAMKRKYVGEPNNEAAGLDDDFFEDLRGRCEVDPVFRDIIMRSMEGWSPYSDTNDPDGDEGWVRG